MTGRKILVLSNHTTVSKKGDRLYCMNSSKSISLPLRYIDAVIAFGSVSFTSQAVDMLMKAGIYIFFLSRFGKLKGVLVDNFLKSNNNYRLLQYKALMYKRADIAKVIVREKIKSIESMYKINMDNLRKELHSENSVEGIMGIEGIASKIMFKEFAKNIKNSGLEFGGRKYNPPPDRVNALLSLAYTFSYCLAFTIVINLGYDPYISFLHTKRGTHASFCSDIIEPVRPFITKKLEDPIIRKVFSKDDFNKQGNGFYLKKESYEKFLNWFEGIKEDIIDNISKSIIQVGEVLK